MAQINGITVRVSDGIKTADYAPPRLYDLTANITFEAGDDHHQVIENWLVALRGHGQKFLTGSAPTAPTGEPKPAAPPKTRTKAATQSPPASPPEDPASLETAPPDPSALTDEPKTEPSSDPATLEDWAAPKVISDQELTAHTTRRNSELGDPGKVRALIQTYKPADAPATRVWTLSEIPQEQRADYLAKLKDLA